MQQNESLPRYLRCVQAQLLNLAIGFTRAALVVVATIALTGLFALPLASPQEETVQKINTGQDPDPKKPEEKKEKAIDYVAMPIPIVNPTIGNGLGVAAMLLYKVHESAPTSNTTAGGIYTDTDSWAVGIHQTTYLKEDKYRANGTFGYFNFNLKFYGIGTEPGDKGRSIPISQDGYLFKPEFLRRFRENFHLGARYRLIDLTTSFDAEDIVDPALEIPKSELEVVSSGLGPVLDFDTRDNHQNPSQGTFFNFALNFADDGLGSDFDYQICEAHYNHYFKLAERMVLAFRLSGRFTFGDAPFWDLSLFGLNNDLRGYVGGQYRDNMLLATQLEYRWQFYWRFGMVAFAGVGEVAPEIDEFNTEDLLPSAGVGVRFMLSKKNRVNISVDYAVGRATSAFYFYIGEAF